MAIKTGQPLGSQRSQSARNKSAFDGQQHDQAAARCEAIPADAGFRHGGFCLLDAHVILLVAANGKAGRRRPLRRQPGPNYILFYQGLAASTTAKAGGVGRGTAPRPQPQTGRASFQASGFPDDSTLLRASAEVLRCSSGSLQIWRTPRFSSTNHPAPLRHVNVVNVSDYYGCSATRLPHR